MNSKSMYNRSKIPRLNVMFTELEENKKIYDEVELEEEVVKLKEKHNREPGLEDPPPPPCKRQKRWHTFKKKKWKLAENIEKDSKEIETNLEVDIPTLVEKVSESIEKNEVIEEDKKPKMFPIFDPNKVFVFNAKNVKQMRSKQKYSKRGEKMSKNPILNYFTTGRGTTSQQTSFPADKS